MSHQPERIEKDCLNCGTVVKGRYCHFCGQENIVQHQNFWMLARHFVYDIFHFDGKFFDTLWRLVFRPGFVPKEYVSGRRHSFLDPIRMYLFTSALFFVVFFATANMSDVFKTSGERYLTKSERLQLLAELYHPQKLGIGDTVLEKKMNLLLDTTKSLFIIKQVEGKKYKKDSSFLITLNSQVYRLHPEVDTLSSRDTSKKLSDIDLSLNRKWQKYKREYGDDTDRMMGDFSQRFVHWFPYMLFVSLPLFALILKLLYIRRKKFFYSDHAVFTLYLYIFSFLLLLTVIALQSLSENLNWGFLQYLIFALLMLWHVYLFLAMKRFYKQGVWKTFGKFVFVNLLGFISILFIFAFFTFLFIYQL